MKKIFLSLAVIFTFIFYSLHQRLEASDEAGQVVAPLETATPTPQMQFSSIGMKKMMSGQYKNGEYTGNVADAYYGNVQVKAIIAGGKITDVQFLQYPHDRRTSVEINSQAMPMLKQEAIQVQNAQVNTVTGATQTSRAFRESLQSALDQAKI